MMAIHENRDLLISIHKCWIGRGKLKNNVTGRKSWEGRKRDKYEREF